MPNLLEYIGQGLRTAGGISSPQVFQANVQREAQLNKLKAARDQAFIEHMVQGVQNGSIPQDVYQRAASKVPGLPPLGPSAATQQITTNMQERQAADAEDQALLEKYKLVPSTATGGPGSLDEQGNLVVPIGVSANNNLQTMTAYAQELSRSRIKENRDKGLKLLADLRAEAKVGQESSPEIVKLQNAQDALDKNSPNYATKYKELQDRIDILSQRNPHNTQMERAVGSLVDLLRKKASGQQLTYDDYLNALSAKGVIESQSRATQDPQTGTIVFTQAQVPPEYSIERIFGKNIPQPPAGQAAPRQPTQSGTGVTRNGAVTGTPPEGQVTTTQIGNQKITTVQGPGARPSAQQVQVMAESDTLARTLEDMKKLYNPDWVGPIAGRAGAIQSKTTGFPNEPGRADFIAKSAIYKDRMIKFITGAQMSEQETARLINEIPDVNDPPDMYEAKRRVAAQNIQYVVDAYQRAMQQGNIRPIGPQSAPGQIPVQSEDIPQGTPLWTPEDEKRLQELERKRAP